jgi:DNA replication protein DnaC
MVQTATLPLMLKQLRLSSVARHWQGMLASAERNGWDSAQYLSALCERELAERHSRRIARYTKDSHLPVGKSLASFDFAQVPGLSRARIEALAGSSDWTRQARNVLLFGASGVGKTHLAAAIGHGLAAQSIRVRYGVTTALVQDLQLARQHLRLEDALH